MTFHIYFVLMISLNSNLIFQLLFISSLVFLLVLRIKDNNDLDLNFKYRDISALDIPSKEKYNDFDDLDYIFDLN
jgi:hypothetical protein